MAFVAIKADREIVAIFRTLAEAQAYARTDTTTTAFATQVSDRLEPGDFINAGGTRLTAPPASARDARLLVERTIRSYNAFQMFLTRQPVWRAGVDGTNYTTSFTAAVRWAWHQIALTEQIAGKHFLSSLSLADRRDTVEHILKEVEDDRGDAYHRFLATPTNRNAWANAPLESEAGKTENIRTDLLTGSTVRDPDGAYTQTTATIPIKFDPSYQELRRP